MKIRTVIRIQFIVAIFFTLLSLFYAFTQSIEEPLYSGENAAIGASICLNIFWLLPFILYYSGRRAWSGLKFSLLLYVAVTLPFIAYRYYKPAFNSERWKAGLNDRYVYVNVPTHTNGNMVQDIIESRMLIGKSKAAIINLLGKAYYSDSMNGKPVMQYHYSNGKLFDGCDKLCVEILDDKCSASYFCGCD